MTSAVDSAATHSPATQQNLSRLREVTREVAGSVFYGELLKNMRGSSMKGEYGHGGRGEEVFAAQLHAELAQRMGQATRIGLGETLYQRLAGQQIRIGTQFASDRSTNS